MASEIRVNSLSSRTGLSTVTFTDTGPIFSGITTFQDNSGFNVGTGGSIFSPASNTITLGTNNAERLRITSAGNIGIGTDNPATKLEVRTGDTVVNVLRVRGNTQSLNFGVNETAGGSFVFESLNQALRFGTNDTERLRITSAGNVGIGTDNPIERLHLIGGSSSSAGTQVDIMRLVASDFSPTNSGGLTIGAVWHNTDVSRRVSYLQSSQNLNSGSTNRALCLNPNGGTIGIGTDDPNRLLHIKGASSTAYSGGSDTADYNFLKIENTTNDKSAGVFFLIGSNGEAAITATEVADGNTDIVFQNRGGGVRSEKVRITSDGKVGINDTNPSYHLSIEGTGAVRNEITCTDNSVAGAGVYFRTMNGGSMVSNATIRTDNTGNLQIFTGTSSDSEKLRITSDGNMGLGTNSPNNYNNYTTLTLNGSYGGELDFESGGTLLADTFANSTGYYFTTRTAIPIRFHTTNSGGTHAERFRITSDGNVGINEDNPRAKLDVRGTALIADDIGSTLPSTFPASDVQLMVYTSTNGTPISNTNCARMLLATDAKQTGPQGYNGAIDFGNSDSTASGQNNQYNYRVASIMSQALADTEANAADGNLEFWTKTSTGSLSKKMGISAEGYVTKSNHPCFDAVRNSGHMSAAVYINYNTVNLNIGSHYNSSNGRFTAPVDGYYFFSYGTIKNGDNNVSRLYIHKNGSATYGSRHLRMDNGQDYGDNGAMTVVIQLAKNDYIQIYLGAGSIYGVTTEYCYFNGYLIG